MYIDPVNNTYSFSKDINTTPSAMLLRNPRYPYGYFQNKESNELLIRSVNQVSLKS